MTFYSQHGQDKWVLEKLNYKKNGFFIDSGAYRSQNLSNTYVLEKDFGWNGICIEPQPNLYKELSENRKCTVVKCTLDDKIGEANFIYADGLSGILENMCAFDYNRVSNLPEYRNKNLKELTKKTSTVLISDILEEYKAPEIIDYWSLDTEGSEYPILKSFPWHKHKVILLTVEHNQGEPHCSNVRNYMSELGYEIFPNLLCPWEDHFSKIV
jgi:FkbM family methyltransferase